MSSSLIFGSAVHEAIESIVRSQLDGGNAPTVDKFLTTFDATWSDNDGRLIDFGKGATAKTLRELAVKMFSLLLSRQSLLSNGQILGVEKNCRHH